MSELKWQNLITIQVYTQVSLLNPQATESTDKASVVVDSMHVLRWVVLSLV